MQPGSKINFAELGANLDIAARNYWKNRLEGFESPAYFDFAGSTTSAASEYHEYSFEIPPPVVNWMQSVAASPKAKHVLLMTSLGILLYKYSGATDSILFTPTYTTTGNKETGNLVPVRLTNLFNATFKEALLQLKEMMVQDMQFGNYPIEKKLSHLPVINKPATVALLVEEIQQAQELNAIQPGILFSFSGASRLTITAKASYHKNDIQRLALSYCKVLETVAADPSIPVNTINIFYESDLQQLLYQFNHTQADYPHTKTIIGLFEEQAAKTPGNIAVLYGSVVISYQQLKQQVDKVAAYLIKEQQVQKGDLIGVLLDRQPHMIAVLLGILKAGAAYIPVDPAYPSARIHAIVADASLKVLVTTATYRQLKSLSGITIAGLEEIEQYIKQQPAEAIAPIVTPNDLAYVIYTSGSTGKPKGVMIEHRSLVNYIYWASMYYVRGDADIFPLYTSVSFDLTVTSIYTPLISGNAILIYPEHDRELLVSKIFTDNVATVIKLTPSHLKIIRDNPDLQWKTGDKTKKLIVGGENLESQLAKAIHDKFEGHIEIYNEYGPTEATVGCMIHRFNTSENFLSVPIGIPNANNRLYIFNKQLQLSPVNVWGELYIAGDGLARGYANNLQLTTERFIEHPFIKGERIYKTGDWARRLENGMLEYAGRIDEQVKIRGYRVELADIEHELSQHEAIKETAVIVWENENNKQLVAYYISDQQLETVVVQQFLSERLPVYMVPSLFVRLQQFPLTINGKLDRKALPDPSTVAKKRYVPPADEIEERLAEIWAEVLDIQKEEVSTEINFFELGGDSISILKLNSRINTQFQCNIPVTDMFMLPTIKAIQKVLKEGVPGLPQTDMISAQEDRELIFTNREN